MTTETTSPHGAEVAPHLRSWASIVEPDTIEQAARTARLPIVHDHVALMADAHLGLGATIGSVVPTQGAIIPAAVGVDIGCGMAAVPLPLPASSLGDDLSHLVGAIERAVPAGVGQGHAGSTDRADAWFAAHPAPTEHSEKDDRDAHRQFGSLGSGNHFVELCLDETDRAWVLLHSGSRGIGNRLATRWIARARALEFATPLEDRDLAYFTEGTEDFAGYIADMLWAQDYAAANRAAMLDAIADVLVAAFDGDEMQQWRHALDAGTDVGVVNCHHNYATREVHDGIELWITRKGAIRARRGDLGLIPGSMGASSFVVRGLGNAMSWESCSHGAGRAMSRTMAKKSLTAASLRAAMGARAWQASDAAALVDEHPEAYKSIDRVMADQTDLVEVVHELRQVLNYKGVR